jgi:hypothetical protein
MKTLISVKFGTHANTCQFIAMMTFGKLTNRYRASFKAFRPLLPLDFQFVNFNFYVLLQNSAKAGGAHE